MPFHLLAQLDQGPAPIIEPVVQPGFWEMLGYWLLGWQGWLSIALTLWMVISCVRRDPERYVWLWIILVFPFFGAVLYFFARYLPSQNWDQPVFLQRWTRRGEIRRLEVAAAQIGNAHQFVQLGEALQQVGRTDEAATAFGKALAKEPLNLPALWGAANADFRQEDFKAAQIKLATILERDPNYKFGDVSLLFGKSLYQLGEIPAAQVHMEEHVCKWRQPEGLYLLAKICLERQEFIAARKWLEELIVDIDSSPKAIARKYMFWKSRARRLLRRVPKNA